MPRRFRTSGLSGVLVAVALLTGTGCSTPKVELIGRFELSPTEAPTGNSRLDKLAQQLTSNSTVEFQPDGVCKLSLATRTVKGRYRMSDRHIEVNLADTPDLADVPAFEFDLVDGGKTLVGTVFGVRERFTKV